MERKNKPSAIPTTPTMPQPIVDLSNNILTAHLPSGDSVEVYLYGATVTSWKTSNGQEQLFLSSAAVLNGTKPIRGGIPLVFPVFGPPPKNHATSALPQHGFARNNTWEFLGKSSSESLGQKADDSVQLDFGLSSSMLDEKVKGSWPHEFGLVYSVTLGKGRLEIQLQVQNKGEQSFEFQSLFHKYLAIKVRLQSCTFEYADKSYRTFPKQQSRVLKAPSISTKCAPLKLSLKNHPISVSKARLIVSIHPHLAQSPSS